MRSISSSAATLEDFLERPVEAAILDHESPEIHMAHLLCAAFEGPLSGEDAEILGPRWEAYAEALVSAGELRRRTSKGRALYVPRDPGDYPPARVSLRSASPDSFAIVDVSSGELLGTTEAARAHSTVHQGAIYHHQGRSYEVQSSTSSAARRWCGPSTATGTRAPSARPTRTSSACSTAARRWACSCPSATVSVTETVLAYQRIGAQDHKQVDLIALDLPTTSFTTQAMWYELDAARLAEMVSMEKLLGTLHAAEHAQIAVLPLLAMCDRWDIGGLSTNLHPQTGGPTIFIYDGHPGGVGITRTAFLRFEELCRDA